MNLKTLFFPILALLVALIMIWFSTTYNKENIKTNQETHPVNIEQNIEVIPLDKHSLKEEATELPPIVVEDEPLKVETLPNKEQEAEIPNNLTDKEEKLDNSEKPINLALTRYRYENVQKLLLENKKSLLNFSYPHIRSPNPNAITIVGFFDFANENCRKMYPIIDKIARSGRVNYIFRDHLINKAANRDKDKKQFNSYAALAAFKAYILDYSNHLDFRKKLVELPPDYSNEEVNNLAEESHLNPHFNEFNLDQIELIQISPFEKYKADTQNLADKFNILEVKKGFVGDFFWPPLFIIGDAILSGERTEEEIMQVVAEQEKIASSKQSLHGFNTPSQLIEKYSIDPNSEDIIKQYKNELILADDCDNYYPILTSPHPTNCNIIGFCDFLEEDCQAILPEIKKLIATNKVTYMFRDFPFNIDDKTLYKDKISLASIMLNIPSLPKNTTYLDFLEESSKILKRYPEIDLSFLLTEFGFASRFYSAGFSPLPTKELIASNIYLADKLNYSCQPTFIIGEKFIVRGIISSSHLLDLLNKAGCGAPQDIK